LEADEDDVDRAAEDLALALRDQLKSYSSTAGLPNAAGIIASETEARKELNQAKERLSHLEGLLGPDGNAEIRELVAKVESRDETIRFLEANLKAASLASRFVRAVGKILVFDTRLQSPEMLIKEVEQLSSAWQALDEQSRDKVFELVNHEEKLAKLTAEVSLCPFFLLASLLMF
jgi:E3 ubiquitin-protein ligase BRE1